MKRTILSALTVLAATAVVIPTAQAAQPFEMTHSLHAERLEDLDTLTKGSVHDLRIDHLSTQTKAVDNLQATRLTELDARTKGAVHSQRLTHLDNQTKSRQSYPSRSAIGYGSRSGAY